MTAEEFWQFKNGGKPSELSTIHEELITPSYCVSLIEEYHKGRVAAKPFLIVRILISPIFATLSLIGAIFLWLRWVKNYVTYGGEAVAYTKEMNPITLSDLFDKISKGNYPR